MIASVQPISRVTDFVIGSRKDHDFTVQVNTASDELDHDAVEAVRARLEERGVPSSNLGSVGNWIGGLITIPNEKYHVAREVLRDIERQNGVDTPQVGSHR